MGLFNFLKKVDTKKMPDNLFPEKKAITNETMKPFENLGYIFDNPIFSLDKDGIMLLSDENQKKAIREVEGINQFLDNAKLLIKIPKSLFIDAEKLEFGEKIRNGVVIERYSFLICSPYTQTNKMSKYPLSLNFASAGEVRNSFSGRLYYMQNGSVGKANISVFSGNEIYIFTLGMVGTTLSLKKIECASFDGNQTEVIYKQ